MCGIVGIISKNKQGLYYSDITMFQNMLVLDSLRGEDSTGAFGIFTNKQAKTIKVAAEPHLMFRTEEWDTFKSKAISSMRILVGHNRSATRGAVTTENAHPFNEGKIVLVHNGTLNNHKTFNKEVEVDSHAITHALNERPAKEVLSEIDGAFAFVWYDREQGKLFIARNRERPLHYVETNTHTYFGSEPGMLEYLLNRSATTATPAKAYAYPVGKLISYDMHGNAESEDFDLYHPKYLGGYQKTYTQMPPTKIGMITTDIKNNYNEKRLAHNTKVLLNISSISLGLNNINKCNGKIIHPTINTDFSGTFSNDLKSDDINNLAFNKICEGTVTGSINTTCGLSYYIKNVEPAETITVYNKTKLPKLLWEHICKNNKCDKCGNDIHQHQADLTSVKIKNLSNKFRVVCPDCVMEALDAATTPTKLKDSNNDVQEGESVCKVFTDWPNFSNQQECAIH